MEEKNIFSGSVAHYHLPGLFEFYEFYRIFLPLFFEHREYFYDDCDIGSVYGAPEGCLWNGGRVSSGDASACDVLSLVNGYGISARLTFSNSLLGEEHLKDRKCNKLCQIFSDSCAVQNGVILTSDLLLRHLEEKFSGLYFVSSTTKVITDFEELQKETDRSEFRYIVPDFRWNNQSARLSRLTKAQKEKFEFLCNECCAYGCTERKACYEAVSRKNLGDDGPEHVCPYIGPGKGYIFSEAMKNPGFIGPDTIRNYYLPNGFSNFKIEGRSLGSALLLEFLLYYMTKPEYQLQVREKIYLTSSLDLF